MIVLHHNREDPAFTEHGCPNEQKTSSRLFQVHALCWNTLKQQTMKHLNRKKKKTFHRHLWVTLVQRDCWRAGGGGTNTKYSQKAHWEQYQSKPLLKSRHSGLLKVTRICPVITKETGWQQVINEGVTAKHDQVTRRRILSADSQRTCKKTRHPVLLGPNVSHLLHKQEFCFQPAWCGLTKCLLLSTGLTAESRIRTHLKGACPSLVPDRHGVARSKELLRQPRTSRFNAALLLDQVVAFSLTPDTNSSFSLILKDIQCISSHHQALSQTTET